MLGIRGKLSLGFGGLLLIIIAIGVLRIRQFTTLGHSIDVILRENYRSVIACQQMKEAIERMDSGTLFVLLGDVERGEELLARNRPIFEEALHTELNNITLAGEAERAVRIGDLFKEYQATLQVVQSGEVAYEDRKAAYFVRLLPLFNQIKSTADEILRMNQQSMADANFRARATAAAARHRMVVLLLFGAVIAAVFILFAGRWILRPISRLMGSIDDIRRGNLDLVVQSDSRDEIGRLSEAFNDMASSLRELRRSDRNRMVRIQRSTQQVFKSLPDAVAVVDLDERVEVSTEAASEVFGLKHGTCVHDLAFGWMESILNRALLGERSVEAPGNRSVIQRFVKGEEHFFRPEAIPILNDDKQIGGAILVLKDVTQQMQQDELKRGIISTVSHQLKTPLTSLRMAVYLLLEEKAGPLTPKQVELLVAAREDSDRLHSILGNLLDISRIESGRMQMSLKPVSPYEMLLDQVDFFQATARDRGIVLDMDIPDDLPEVMADRAQIGHVLANLLSNALKYTSPGGRVTITAKAREEDVCIAVSDTGRGIPAQYLDRVFEQFFRVPDLDDGPGEGLGLAIAREIIEAHEGVIDVESEEGKGSVFRFCLRRADLAPSGDEHAQSSIST